MLDTLKQYDVIDTFDENPYQTVTMGIDNRSYQDIVIINKIKKSKYVNDSFLGLYKKVSDNILAIESDDLEYLIINKYEQSQLLSDYMTEQTLNFSERVRLAKSFLYQLSFYEDFNFEMQYILVNADQLIISHGNLKFSNYVFMKTFKENIHQKDLHKIIVSILELILEFDREVLTTDLSALQAFLSQLLHQEMELSYNDIYNKFKVLASVLSNDGINFTSDFEAPIESKSHKALAREERLDHEDNTDEIILIEDILQVDEVELLSVEETISFNDELNIVDEQEEAILLYDEDTFDSIDQISEQQPSEENHISLEDLIKEVEEFDDIIDDVEPLDAIISLELTDELISEDEVLVLLKQVELSDERFNDPSVSEAFDISDKLADSIIQEKKIIEDKTLINDDSKLHMEVLLWDNNSEREDELQHDTVAPLLDIQQESIKEELLSDKTANAEYDVKEKYEPVPKLPDGKKLTYDERKHSVVLENDPNGDPIQEILNRNEKQHSDLFINQTRTKKKFLPTFLLFFIILILITSLLIFYTSKYM